ncbi:hypothetical protein ZOSMA_162G00360 [Zostera marina]|uniref:Fe2OG dioxygenase domain-containing protein n=1 Tax=Zostera marina TaxID=29655 RepID=A0A0K9PW91_ZOSMR|nr:hypothetical protein ZOSMA_162G00360 [Zostera marina]
MVFVEQNLLLSDLVARNRDVVPIQYVRPISERPNLEDVIASDKSNIPIVDLQGIDGSNWSSVVKAIGLACQSDGFFQVNNHGISEELMANMICVSREFFRLPVSERNNSYSDSPLKANRLSTSFNVNTEKFGCWRDYLRLHCDPLEDFIHEWPSNPPSFRDVASEYSKKIRELALKLLGCISESLGLDKDSMKNSLGKHAQHMAINYYPTCSDPQLTYGLPAHKDPNAITLLLQDNVPGLQVLKNGKWVAVNPIPNLVVNIGDQIEVLSNGRYKSVLHRAIVNREQERMSIPTFYCPSMDSIIQPHKSLVDHKNTQLYRTFTYGEYYEMFWNRGLSRESCLDLFTISQN